MTPVISADDGNCLGCHDDTVDNMDVNSSSINISVHANLNNLTPYNLSINPLNRACWACHGNGTPPVGNHSEDNVNSTNPANKTKPLNCNEGKCHVNGTPSGSNINGSPIPIVLEHVPDINGSSSINTIDYCNYCHNKSLTSRIDPVNNSIDETVLSNISHYGNTSSLLSNTWNCDLCHKDVFIGKQWNTTSQIRHPINISVDYCKNCHGTGTTFHNENLSKAGDIHAFGFDWEGDGIDYTDDPAVGRQSQDNEGCVACHDNNKTSEIMAAINADGSNTIICEECHYNTSVGVYNGPFYGANLNSRTDIEDAIPRVFNHINDTNATIFIKKMNGTFDGTTSSLDTPSSCFSYNNNTGNGACHGVRYDKRIAAGGYYAFNNLTDPADNMSAYEYTMTIDRMPNTSDCRICHLGINPIVGILTANTYWGNPRNVSSTAPLAAAQHTNASAKISDCWDCHIAGKNKIFIDFHDANITAGGGPDCISCHDIGRSGATKWVNVSAINGSINSNASIHRAINNATEAGAGGSTGNPDNQICWACHQTGGIEPTGMGDKYNTPYLCYECHGPTPAYNNVSNAPKVFEHFLGGDNLTAANVSGVNTNSESCLVCHNRSEMKVVYSEGNDNYSTNFSIPSHYSKNRSDLRNWTSPDGTETVNCNYCHKNSSTDFKAAMNDPIGNSNISEHSRYSSTPSCTNSTCHNGGWMHNESLQKPDLTTNDSGGAEDSRICFACHSPANASGNVTTGAREKHNGSLDCTECHLYVKQDIHGVKYLQSNDNYTIDNTSSLLVNCKICHNYSVSLTNISIPRPFVPTDTNDNFNHSNNASAGQIWGNYWNNDTEACEYCHRDSKHNNSALGRLSVITGSASNSTDLANTGWCRACHYNDSSTNYLKIMVGFTADGLPIPPEITNGTGWNGTSTNYFNHTIDNFNDSGCRGCHGQLLSSPASTREFPHNVAEGNFGPDCINCHDIAGPAPKIDVSVVNNTLSLHQNIRTYTNISNPFGVNETNKICWACHMDNGQSPANQKAHADRLGEFNSVPVWTCVECHVGSEPYVNLTGLAPDVFEHFFGGIDLKAGNSSDNLSSCLTCHNLSEMKLLDMGASEADNPTDASYLVAHYGKKRSTGADNIRTWNSGVNCSYCHQNSSSAFAVNSIMVNPAFNSSIREHSRYSSTPNCTNSTCHNGGWMHNKTLQKPDLTTNDSGGAEDSRICLECHHAANASTYLQFTTAKTQHNGSVNCTECHLYVKQDIHGVRYLQSNDVYTTDNTSSIVVNCKTCHSYSVVLNNISMSRPFIPTDSNDNFSHSEDPDNGSRWANASVVGYWNSSNEACEYCHNDTKHDTNAFGKTSFIRSTNSRNQTIDGSSTWCGGCHYQNATNYFVTGNFSKIPPTILINNTQLVNSTDDNSNTWFNHTLSGYSDNLCKGCHGGLLSIGARSKEFVHNVGVGQFGADCVECHALTSPIAPRIDINVLNSSLHTNLNNNSPYTGVLTNNLSKACWACHSDTTDGNPPSVHPFLNIITPRICEDCHTTIVPSLFSAPLVSEHRPGALDVETNASCVKCHNNSVDASKSGWTNITNDDRVSHYGNTDNLLTWVPNGTQDCKYCHFNDSYNISWGYPMDPRITVTNLNHSNYNNSPSSACYYCHAGNKTPPDFHDGSVTGGAGKDCVSCHDIGGAAPTPKWLDVSAMNDSKDIHYDLNRRAIATTTINPNNVRCWACHGDGDGTENAQPDGHPANYNKPKSCSNNDCHAVNQSIFGEPMVYEHFRYADTIDEDIETSVDCEACHKNSLQTHIDEDIKSDGALVSHYGSTRDLINSSSCIYCHLDEDNAEEWGNAPDPTDNETTLSDTERNATIYLGEKWYIGNKYQFYFKDIAKNGDAALIQILHNNEIINETIIEDNEQFVYTRDFLDREGDEIESVIFSINITAVFRGHEDNIITIKGRTMKRIHSEYVDESCYACHMDSYTRDKSRYLVIDKDNDNTYYTKLYVDFEEDEIDQELLAPSPGRDIVIPEGYNQTWTVNGFTFFAKDVHIQGGSVYINLELNDVLVADTVYDEGETIEYEEDLTVDDHTMNDIVLFRADVAKVFTGLEANAVILTNVRIISDKPALVDNDDDIRGYNASWLQIDDIFSIGGAPDNLHVPPLNDGVDGGPDCVMCHDISAGFGIPSIDAISTHLGGHAGLNKDAYNRTKLTDTIDKACWACHGDGKEPQSHPVNYIYPRRCQDCHVEQESPTYGAIDLSDEEHGQVEECNRCHAADYPGLHVINVFEPLTPYIVRINVHPEVVQPGQSVNVSTAAMSGWNLKVQAIEYFIDIEGLPGTGVTVEPLDGIFNEQVEEAEFIVDTSGLELGNHTVYLRSMQRDDKWGPVNSAVFSIEPEIPKTSFPWWIIILILVILGIIGSILVYKRRQSEQIGGGF